MKASETLHEHLNLNLSETLQLASPRECCDDILEEDKVAHHHMLRASGRIHFKSNLEESTLLKFYPINLGLQS